MAYEVREVSWLKCLHCESDASFVVIPKHAGIHVGPHPRLCLTHYAEHMPSICEHLEWRTKFMLLPPQQSECDICYGSAEWLIWPSRIHGPEPNYRHCCKAHYKDALVTLGYLSRDGKQYI